MNWINQIFSDNFISALGWTILHSIWQGALVAVVFALILISFRKSSSNFRYFLSIIALVAVFGSSLTTFLTSYKIPKNTAEYISQDLDNHRFMIVKQEVKTDSPRQVLTYFGDYFEGHLPLIVSAWSLGIVILMLRFLGGLAYTQRLKYHHAQNAENYWQGTLKYLISELHMRKSVRLLESALVKAPMVIGTLKPVVLVPIGLLSSMPAQQVEMILAHELAHIKRHDYLINLLQSVVEIALFFNPFVWWISANIRQERENCCDDMALSLTGDKMTFVKTLANIEAMRLGTPELAVGFAGKKGSLMNRVSRLLNQNHRKSSFSEGFWSAVVLVLCLIMASMTFNTEKAERHAKKETRKEAKSRIVPNQKAKKIIFQDTSVGNTSKETCEIPKSIDDTIRFGKDLEYMIVTLPNGKLEVFKDGKKIKEKDYKKHSKAFEMNNGTLTLADDFFFDVEKGRKPSIEIELDDEDKRGSVVFTNKEGKNMTINILKDYKKGFIIKHNNKIVFDSKQFGEDLEIHLRELLSGLENIKLDFENLHFENTYEEEIEEMEEEIEEMQDEIEEREEEMEKELELIQERVERQEKRNDAKFEKKIKAEIIKDGLAGKGKKVFRVSARYKKIKINGKTLSGKFYEKYAKLIREGKGVDIDKKGNSWIWYSDDK